MLGIRARQSAPADAREKYFWTSDVLIDEFKTLHPDEKELIKDLDDSRAPPRPGQKGAKGENDEAELLALAAYYEAVHKFRKNDKEPGQTALCLSGGGIRSAAFALGVLQALARLKLLSQFDYLSTVSGGGYIGGWLSAWAARPGKEGKSLGRVEEELAQIAEGRRVGAEPDPLVQLRKIEELAQITKGRRVGAEPDPLVQLRKIEELAQIAAGRRVGAEPDPLDQLRKNQDFITPKVGLGSADTWAAVAIVIRNVLLNWMVFVPFISALLFVPRAIEWALVSWTRSKHGGSLFLEGHKTFLIEIGYYIFDHLTVKPSKEPFSGQWGEWHYWLDTIGVVLVIFGLVISIANRYRPPKKALDEEGFRKWVMAPLMSGAFLLVMQSCYWVPGGDEPTTAQFFEWVIFGAAVLCVAFVIAISWIAWVKLVINKEAINYSEARTAVLEFAAQFFAGALIGALIWSGLWLRHVASPGDTESTARLDAVFGVPWYLMSFLLGQVLLAALTSRLYPNDGDKQREWWARAGGYYAAAAIIWALAFWLVIFGWQAVESLHAWMLAIAGGSGAVSLLGASPISPALSEALKGVKLSVARLITLASIVFLGCLAIWIAHGSMLLLEAIAPGGLMLEPLGCLKLSAIYRNLEGTTLAAFALFVFSVVASYFVNVNYFSLNAMYRNRLVRSFLGASNAAAPDRNPFDGFADTDNLGMHDLLRPNAGLFHVVNITLNLTATDNNAWQERKAAPFICTPLHTGGHDVGYRSSETYCDHISLGTAMSLSGAAVSPNWGYHSSTATSFVMTIFNARLGGWFGNPKHDTAWKKNGPDSSFRRFVQEALGLTTDKQPFVYLSDGGHFENLGLYEMVRRRCHIIVVCDAGADPSCTLEDLGNAIRKIYIDFGVEIDFERVDVRARDNCPPKHGIYCAVGRIRYPDEKAKDGKIIYIKPGLYEDAPADVKAYAAADAKFPHDDTLNQWFTESQFESYRALGEHAIKMMTGLRDPAGKTTDWPPRSPGIVDLLDFSQRVTDYLKAREPSIGASA